MGPSLWHAVEQPRGVLRFLRKHEAVRLVRTWEEKAKIKGKHLEITQMGQVFRGVTEGISDERALLLHDHGGAAE